MNKFFSSCKQVLTKFFFVDFLNPAATYEENFDKNKFVGELKWLNRAIVDVVVTVCLLDMLFNYPVQ